MSTPLQFGKLRSLFWPIYSGEHKKFVPIFLIFFLICFNYSILRAIKDSLVITAPNAGAEVLPFIKVWGILPAALLFTFIFTRLSNRLSREKIYYALMGIFLGFFLIFTLFLFPNRDLLHPHEAADRLQSILPQGFSGMIALFRNWTFTLFYIMSEMWSTMIMTVLFWGFANEVTSIRDAKRYYAILPLGANLATILSGTLAKTVVGHQFNPNLPFGQDGWSQSLFMLNGIIIFSGILSMGVFRWLHAQGLGYGSIAQTKGGEPEKVQMGIRKIFKYLAKSRYLLCIAMLVLLFNISLTLIEVVWKDQVRQLFPNAADFTAYMSNVLIWIGIVATVGAFASSWILRRFSWTVSALIPPAMFLVTGALFFSCFIFKDSSLASLTALIGTTPLALGVFFGSLQNVMARATKYTLFDATKELSFIPLSRESRLKGKAAIDGFGSRLGKSGASLVHQSLIMVFGTISVSAPFIAIFLLLVVGGWMGATRVLGREFGKLSLNEDELSPTPNQEKEPQKPLATATSTTEG